MDMASKQEDLKQLYNMCVKELDTASKYIDDFKRNTYEIFNSTSSELENSCNFQKCLMDYAETLSYLTFLTDCIRKINIEFEIKMLYSQATVQAYGGKSSPVKDIKLQSNSDLVSENGDKNVYSFTLPNLQKFRRGYTCDCVITFVKNAKENLFYINEIGNTEYSDCIGQMQRTFHENCQPYTEIPPHDVVFAMYMDGYVFRAIRENGIESPDPEKAKFYLIDIGEVVAMEKSYKMYPLEEIYQKIPAQAILCKLESVKNVDCDLSKYLTENLYVQHRVNVVHRSLSNSVLHVELQPDLNPFRNHVTRNDDDKSENNNVTAKSLVNPFSRYACGKLENFHNNSIIVLPSSNDNNSTTMVNNIQICEGATGIDQNDAVFNKNIITNDKSPSVRNPYEHFDLNLSKPSTSNDACNEAAAYDLDNCLKFATNTNQLQLTDTELEMLYEEPMNTSNALKAVIGYEPKDDRRICRFYDPKNDNCFKGANCKFEHVKHLEGGWTRDGEMTTIDIRNKIVFPPIGSIVKILPSQILNVEEFFAQIIHPKSQHTESLRELIYKMNGPEAICAYKKLRKPLARLDLVIALYTDALWYRAKVINIIDEINVKVFYVDFGNSEIVPLTNLRQWEPRYDYLPFQAIRCRLYGITKKGDGMCYEAIGMLRKMIVDQTLVAEVMSNIDDLVVKLFDAQQFPISEMLVAMGYAIQTGPGTIPTNQILPG